MREGGERERERDRERERKRDRETELPMKQNTVPVTLEINTAGYHCIRPTNIWLRLSI